MTEAHIMVNGHEIRYVDADDNRIPIDRADQIPAFASETEEQEFWETHTLSGRFWQESEPVPPEEAPAARLAKERQKAGR